MFIYLLSYKRSCHSDIVTNQIYGKQRKVAGKLSYTVKFHCRV